MLKKLAAYLAMLLVWGCSAAPKEPVAEMATGYDDIASRMRQLIESRMRASDIAGLSIVLIDDQQVVWSEGFGFADRQRRIRATSETLYKVGSISKLLTATAVMQLRDQGKLDIDHSLAEYLPEFSIRSRFAPPDEAVRGITLRHIMTHHAGLPENNLQGILSTAPGALAALPGKMASEYVTAPPGAVVGYSNLGYSLLGAAVERVAGRDFDTHMRDALLRPLGMPAAGFVADVAMAPHLARGHKESKPEVDPDIRDLPAGALRASVGDLANFMRMIFAGGVFDGRRILQQQSIDEMLRVQNASVTLDFDCKLGLAWMLSSCGGETVGDGVPTAGHSGATRYFNSQLLLSPAQKLGVVVLSNDARAGPEVGKLAAAAMRLMLGIKTGKPVPPPTDEENTARHRPDARTLAFVPGWYATSLGALKVEARDERLLVEVAGLSIELLEDGRGRLHPRLANPVVRWVTELSHDESPIAPASLRLLEVAGREVVTIRVRGQELLLGEKAKATPIPKTWQTALGFYRVINGEQEKLFDEAILKIEDGLLLAETTPVGADRKLRLALKPVSDTEAVIYGLGRGLGETVRLECRDDGPRLHFSGYQMTRQEQL